MLSLEEGQYLGTNQQTHRFEGLNFIDTAYHKKVFNGWHAHERPHLTFVLNGGNREERKSSDQQLLVGRVLFYHSDELHRNDHTVFPSRNLNLEIEPGFFKDYQLHEQAIDQAVRTGKLTALEFIRLSNEALFMDVPNADSLHLLFLSFIMESGSKIPPDWLFRLRELLNDRWDSWPTLLDLSDETGVHPVTISKYFHRFFGCTLSTYMRKLKAQQGLAMIRSSRYSLSEIAYACGFADQSHFIRCFKAQTGMLPKDFKQV